MTSLGGMCRLICVVWAAHLLPHHPGMMQPGMPGVGGPAQATYGGYGRMPYGAGE